MPAPFFLRGCRIQNDDLIETNEDDIYGTFYLLLALVCSGVGGNSWSRQSHSVCRLPASSHRTASFVSASNPDLVRGISLWSGFSSGHFLFYVFVSLSFCSVIFPLFSLLFACCVHISTNVTPERANYARVDGNLRE